MSEKFEPITTQEEFDARIGERLKREKETSTKKIKDLEDELAPLKKYKEENGSYKEKYEEANGKLTALEAEKVNFEKEKTALEDKIKVHESNSVKMRIAQETGLPLEMSSRLTGDDETAIKADAEKMAQLFKSQTPPPPLGTNEPPAGADSKAEFKALLNNLEGDE